MSYLSLVCQGVSNGIYVRSKLACVAGVQRGGRGEVECEREARRELNASAKRALVALRARIQLPPSLPFIRRPRRLCLNSTSAYCLLVVSGQAKPEGDLDFSTVPILGGLESHSNELSTCGII